MFRLTTAFHYASQASRGTRMLANLYAANRVEASTAFGIIALAADFNTESRPDYAVARVGDLSVRLNADDCIVKLPHGWRFLFHVVTHLFPQGVHTATAHAYWNSGQSDEFGDIVLTVENDSALARQVAADLRQHGTPTIFGRVVDSSLFPYERGQARAWFDEIEPTDARLSFDQAPDLESAHRHLERWGFCILPQRLPSALVEQFRTELFEAIAGGAIRHTPGSSERIHHAHRLPAGRAIWLYPPVLEFLESHFRDAPCACQTLTYVHGSEQGPHQDTIHLTPYPSGFMCGVWIALEDVQADSGELFVYPGSHRTPRLRARDLGLEKVDQDYSSYTVFDSAIQSLLREGGYERVEYRPKAGQILVWHENLIHGGSARRNRDLTRLSIVSHYFAKGAVSYYDSRGEAAALEILPNKAA